MYALSRTPTVFSSPLAFARQKTDQEKNGVARMLSANPSHLCPVAAFESFRALLPSVESRGSLFPKSLRATLVQIMKWAAEANDIPSPVASTHSLRVGGATALFSAGADWVATRRRGRWKPFAFRDYIWRDYSGFMDLGRKIASTRGLGKFLSMLPPSINAFAVMTHRPTPPARPVILPGFHLS